MGNCIYFYNVKVEFEDVDSYKIAHHSKLINYLERARANYFNDKGFNLLRQPVSLIVYKIESRFIKPALLFDRLTVELNDLEADSYYVTASQKIKRGKETIFKARVVHALISNETGKVIPIPREFEQLITGQLQVVPQSNLGL